jgi:hypothetical protein
MKKFILLVISLFFPVYLFSQYVIEPGYHVSFEVKPGTLGRTDVIGVHTVKGGFDINKNGKKEFLIMCDPNTNGTSDSTNSFYLLENDGNDKYKVIWEYHSPYPANSYGDVAVGDIDKDGNNEIWVAFPAAVTASNPEAPSLLVFEYDGTKIPTEPTATWNFGVRTGMDIRPFALAIEDVDNDGEPEIVMASRQDDYTSIGGGRTLIIGTLITPLDQGGLNVFQREFIDTSAYMKGGGLYDMRVTDFDGDGKKEVWTVTWDDVTINIFKAVAPNQYQHVNELRQVIPDEDVGCYYGLQFYDANGDGKLECYIAGSGYKDGSVWGRVIFFPNTSDVSKLTKGDAKVLGYQNVDMNNLRGSGIGDIDKDGKMEFATADRNNKSVIMVKYKGTGDLSDSTSYIWKVLLRDTVSAFPPMFENLSLASSDMDGDGYPEILIPNYDVQDASRPMVIVLEATKPGKVKKTDNVIPENFSLGQNYPNPFNPETKIEFSIPKSSQVILKVYNSIGQEVATLVNEQKEAGNYFTTFNALKFPSGTYFYELRAGDFTSKMKMVLVK